MAGNFRGIGFQKQLTSSEISHRSTINARIIIIQQKLIGKDRHPESLERNVCMHACINVIQVSGIPNSNDSYILSLAFDRSA
jgi:hypothetical protein